MSGERLIRIYQSGDEAAIVALWNRACPKQPISMEMFVRRVLVDPNFDSEGLVLYEEDGEILGFTLGIVRKDHLS